MKNEEQYELKRRISLVDSFDIWAPLKTPSEKKQLCTASAASIPLVVRKHAFEDFPCTYCTYLFFLAQNGFLEMPISELKTAAGVDIAYRIQGDDEYTVCCIVVIDGEVYGRVLRTQKDVKPVFVSVSNNISLISA